MNGPFITRENATALYSLSKYFDTRPLRLLAKQFWKRDIQALTWKTYYDHALILQQPAVLQRAMTVFWEHVLKMERSRIDMLKAMKNNAAAYHSSGMSDARRNLLDGLDIAFWQHALQPLPAEPAPLRQRKSV
jgi:hypothetical protein